MDLERNLMGLENNRETLNIFREKFNGFWEQQMFFIALYLK